LKRQALALFGVSLVAAVAAGWPLSVAYSTSPMTAKQARLAGMTTTRKQPEQRIDRLIVKLRAPTVDDMARPMSATRAQALSSAAGMNMKSVRALAGGSHLMKLDAPMSLAEARVVAARLASDPTIEYAEPDIMVKRLTVPNETRFTQWQWNLFAPATVFAAGGKSAPAAGGANMPPAWDLTTGSSAVVVAVIDSGITNHTDLNGVANADTYVPAGRFLPGYDFVSSDVGAADMLPSNFVANDGNGRDADPSDPGDWITAAEKALYPNSLCADGVAGQSDSTWHGTHMAGSVAATANNATGIAGVGWNIRVLPVRALGKCGGNLSDIEEAIRWAAGLPVAGVPNNPNPAQVISLSLGGGNACGPTMQAAVTAATTAGALVVAATGNEGDTSIISPANCTGAIGVTAHTINGENADYANVGAGTAISAPGGGTPSLLGNGGPTDDVNWDGYYIHSTILFGVTTPTSAGTGGNGTGPAYAGFTGTSPATPQVAGVAALLKSVLPAATPAQIRSYLVTNVRPYPAGSACAAGGAFVGMCGSGLLDANLALLAAGPEVAPTAAAGADQGAPPGSTVTLNGSASTAFAGKTITSYQWTQTAGTPTVTLSTPNAVATTFTAPTTGTLTFRLRVTDSNMKIGDDFVVVRSNNAPVLAAASNVSAVSGSVVTFSVTAMDADGDPLTFVATTASTVPLSALTPTGQFSWNTLGAPAGTYQLTYFATDTFNPSATQTVTITLTAPPTAANPPSSGGGGALPLAQWLLMLVLLAVARIQRRPS
jgi:serine protease